MSLIAEATREVQLAADLATALDPARILRPLGITLDPWQAAVLRSTAPRLLLNCSRQSGKSLTAAGTAVHTAIYQPESLILLLSPSLRQSQETFRKCLTIYRALGDPVPAEAETKLTLELANGSRIISLPGKEMTVRGFSGVSFLVIDEAARVGNDLYGSIRPMLAVSGGRIVALSTPFGARGWWFEAWRGDEPWERYEVPATACPRISPAFLEEERRVLGEWYYQQEFCCGFADAETQAFRRDDVDRAFAEETEPWAL